MYCNYCGTELDGNRCGNCGATTQLNSKRIVSQVDLGPQVFECDCGTTWESTEYTQKKYHRRGEKFLCFTIVVEGRNWDLQDHCPKCNCHEYKSIDIK